MTARGHPGGGDRAGHLGRNIAGFARVLRGAGLALGTDRILLAMQAALLSGTGTRADFRATLACTLLTSPAQRPLFDEAFDAFWRDPDVEGRMRALLLPRVRDALPPPPPASARLRDALWPNLAPPPAEPTPRVDIDAHLSFSAREVLRRVDFDDMTAAQWHAATAAIAGLLPRLPTLRSRRLRPVAGSRGTVDWRASLRAQARSADLCADWAWHAPTRRPAPLVLLADISGSMGRYTRMLLHFMHAAIAADWPVETFVFGTRLTRITRDLRDRDPDVAIARVAARVQDWSGGTRIAACLHQFHRDWSRRVLSTGATVLLLTDGLERGDDSAAPFGLASTTASIVAAVGPGPATGPADPDSSAGLATRFSGLAPASASATVPSDTGPAAAPADLAREAARLRRLATRLWWLNPLLRHDRYQPIAAGARVLAREVHACLPVHDLDSVAALAHAIAGAERHVEGALKRTQVVQPAATSAHRATSDTASTPSAMAKRSVPP